MKPTQAIFLLLTALSLLFINSKVCASCLISLFCNPCQACCCETSEIPCDHEDDHEDHSCNHFEHECEGHPPFMPIAGTASSQGKVKSAEFAEMSLPSHGRTLCDISPAAFQSVRDWLEWVQHVPETPLFIQHARFLI